LVRQYQFGVQGYLDKLIRYKKEEVIREDLRLADLIAIASVAGSKEGNVQYQVWRRKKQDRLDELKEEENLTVFDKLKGPKRFLNTVFDRLKARGKRYGV